jgi:hypothetical protein
MCHAGHALDRRFFTLVVMVWSAVRIRSGRSAKARKDRLPLPLTSPQSARKRLSDRARRQNIYRRFIEHAALWWIVESATGLAAQNGTFSACRQNRPLHAESVWPRSDRRSRIPPQSDCIPAGGKRPRRQSGPDDAVGGRARNSQDNICCRHAPPSACRKRFSAEFVFDSIEAELKRRGIDPRKISTNRD